MARKKSVRKVKKVKPPIKVNHNGQFGIYETFLSSVIRQQKISHSPRSLVLERIIHSYAREADALGEPLCSFVESGIFQKMVSEYHANRGVPVIFPESKVLLKSLSDSTFKFNKKVAVPMPFKTFSLALPRGIVVEGVKLKAILVSKGSSSELVQNPKVELASMIYDANAGLKSSVYSDQDSIEDFIDLKVSAKSDTSEDQYFTITLQFNDPKAKMDVSSLTATFREEYLSLALKSKTPEQMISLAELYTNDENEKDFEAIRESLEGGLSSNSVIIHTALKILSSTAIYLSLEGNELMKGLPSKFSGEMSNLDGFSPNSSAYFIPDFPQKEVSVKDGVEKGASYRKFHFRNLQHEKYYQGEHKHKERGSRWVPVSPSLINSIDDPYTIAP